MIRTRNVIFDKNCHYRLYEINAAQLIKESFLKNDTLKILQSDFTKFIEIKSNSDEKLFELTSTKTFVVHSSNDEKTKKAINKDDKKYLLSSTSFSLKKENILQSFSELSQLSKTIFTFFSRAIFTRSHFTRTLLDKKKGFVEKLDSFSKVQFASSSILYRFNSLNRRKTSILQIICDINEEEKKTTSERIFIGVKILLSNA